MKTKIFTAETPEALEGMINEWSDTLKPVQFLHIQYTLGDGKYSVMFLYVQVSALKVVN